MNKPELHLSVQILKNMLLRDKGDFKKILLFVPYVSHLDNT